MKNKLYQLRMTKWFAITLIVGLCLSTVAAQQVAHMNARTVQSAINLEVNRIADQIAHRLELYVYGLRGARGAILAAGQENISRSLFKKYSESRDIKREFPGARGFGFVRRVSPLAEADFIANARLDGFPDFAIRQFAEHSGDRYVIQYIEPFEPNALAVGLDVASEEYRRRAAEAAMRSGEATITAPITLVQSASLPAHQSFLVFLPIYKEAQAPETLAEREAHLIGWSYAPILMSEILEALPMDEASTELLLSDVTSTQSPDGFFTSHKQPLNKLTTQIIERELLGRRWQIELSAYTNYTQKLHLISERTIFLMGFVFSVLLAFLIQTLWLNQVRKRAVAEERSRIAAIVDNSADAIIGSDLNDVVVSWNQGAERLFGYSAGEAVGQKITDLIVPDALKNEVMSILLRVRGGEQIPHFNTTRCTKVGDSVSVSVVASPIRDAKGNIIGVSKTLRDITEEQQVQQRIIELNLNLESQVAQRTTQLEHARQSLQTVLDAVPSLIGYWDKNLICHVANRTYHEWFGLPDKAIVGKQAREVLGAELFEKAKPHMEAVLRGEPQVFTVENVGPHGMKYALAHYVPECDENGVNGFYVIVHDITALTESKNQLQKVLSENHALVNTINQQMLYSVTDLRVNILDVNDNFCRSSEYAREQLIGENHRVLNSGTHSPEFWRSLWLDISHGKSWRGEVCNRSRTGSLRWYDTVISPFMDDKGKIERYVALRIDITARKNSEAERNRLNLFITSVLNSATEVSIIATDPDGIITVFNRGAELMLGYEADEIVGKTTPAPFHLMEEIVARGKELSLEYGQPIEGFRVFVHKPEIEGSEVHNWTYVRKDGSHLQISLIATAMRDAQGKITGYLGVATDVTQELKNKKSLETLLDQFGIATKVAQLGIWTWELQDNSLQWSDRMYELYDQPISLRNNGLSYQHWIERVHPEDAAATEASLMAALEGRGVYDPVFRVVSPNGKVKFIQAGAQIERDENGKPIKVTGINLDITAQREIEEALKKAKEAADAASASKSAFLANMSHEIRTPMNAVLGMLQLLQNTELNERQRDYLSKSQTSAKSLLGLLNDILDFSKIESGKLLLDPVPFEVEPLLRDLAVILSANQAGKPVEVLFDIDPRLPQVISYDRLRLQQILINLAGNALKFTHQGYVLVSFKLVGSGEVSPNLLIEIRDTGIGISTEQIQRIFEGFVQAEASITRRYGGTGLGLVICKRLIEMMGGELKLESELGAGSRFWFEIPLVTPEANSQLVAVQPSQQTQRVLVVDDNALSREVITRALRAQGITAEEAGTGLEALEKTKAASARSQPYDLVLMDWLLPDFNGVQAAELIQSATNNQSAPAIIMLTAYGREDVFTKASGQAVPYQELLTKPITPRQLIEAIERVLNPESVDRIHEQPEADHGQPLQGVKLLVVEDNEFNRQVALELLQDKGAKVELAEGGLEGVSKVLTNGRAYDLVIMDVQMPDIDGLEATRRIRRLPQFITLPILAMTANASSSDKEACFAAGMNDHVGKPFEIDEVVNKILALIHRQNTATPVDTQAPNTVVEPAEIKWALLDSPERILGRLGGKVELLGAMFGRFHADVSKLLNTAADQLRQQNYMGVAAAMHSIKGLAGTMGAKQLADKASVTETRLKTPANTPIDVGAEQNNVDDLKRLLDLSSVQLKEFLEFHQKKQGSQALGNKVSGEVAPGEKAPKSHGP